MPGMPRQSSTSLKTLSVILKSCHNTNDKRAEFELRGSFHQDEFLAKNRFEKKIVFFNAQETHKGRQEEFIQLVELLTPETRPFLTLPFSILDTIIS